MAAKLPVAEKISAPGYQEFTPGGIPEVAADGARVRVLAGQHVGVAGAVADPITDVLYLDVALPAGATFRRPLPDSHNAFVYLCEGDGDLGDRPLAAHNLAVLGQGDTFSLTAGSTGGASSWWRASP